MLFRSGVGTLLGPETSGQFCWLCLVKALVGVALGGWWPGVLLVGCQVDSGREHQTRGVLSSFRGGGRFVGLV